MKSQAGYSEDILGYNLPVTDLRNLFGAVESNDFVCLNFRGKYW